MDSNQTNVSQLETIKRGVIQPQEVNSNPTQTSEISRRVTPSHSSQLKFMCEHIIYEDESKLLRWVVTQAKESSKTRKEGLHKDLHKYLQNELHKYLHNFWGVKDKNSKWGNTCENGSYKTNCELHKGVTKPPKGFNQQVSPTQTPWRPTKLRISLNITTID